MIPAHLAAAFRLLAALILGATPVWATSAAPGRPQAPKTPIGELRQKAEAGDAAALEEITFRLFYVGTDGKNDLPAAAKWAQRAADHAEASPTILRHAAGLIVRGRDGTPRDLARARILLNRLTKLDNDATGEIEELDAVEAFESELAALRQTLGERIARGDRDAHFELAQKLGECPLTGSSPHCPEAARHYRAAAEAGHAVAMLHHARALDYQPDLSESEQQAARVDARRWLEKSADAGCAQAILDLAQTLIYDAKVANPAEHEKLAKEAERRLASFPASADAADQVELARAALTEVRSAYAASCKRAEELAAKEQAGDLDARTALACWYGQEDEQPPLKRDVGKAVALLLTAEAAGHAGAASILAHWLGGSKAGVAHDDAESLRFAIRAVELSKAPEDRAMRVYELAAHYERGRGTAADPAKALALLGEATQLLPPGDRYDYSRRMIADALARVQAKQPRPISRAEAVALARAGDAASIARLRDAAATNADAAQALAEHEKALAKIAALRPAAERGAPADMAALAFALGDSLGYALLPAESYVWMARAADAGHVPAMDAAGFMCLDDAGTPRDLAAAATWWTKALAAGSTRGDEFHFHLLKAVGTEPLAAQPPAVVTFLADFDHREALWLAYSRSDIPASPQERSRRMHRAALLGHPDALWRLGAAYGACHARYHRSIGDATPTHPAWSVPGGDADAGIVYSANTYEYRPYAVVCWQAAARAGHAEATAKLTDPQVQAFAPENVRAYSVVLPELPPDAMGRREEAAARLGNPHALLAVALGHRWRRIGTSDTFSESGDRLACRRWLEFLAGGASPIAHEARLHLANHAEREQDPAVAMAHLERIPVGRLPEADALRERYKLAAADHADRAAGRLDSKERDTLARANGGDIGAAYERYQQLQQRGYEWVEKANKVILILESDTAERDAHLARGKSLYTEADTWLDRAAAGDHLAANLLLAQRELQNGLPDAARLRARRLLGRLDQQQNPTGPLRDQFAKVLAAAETELKARWEKRLASAERDPTLRFAIGLDYARGTGGVDPDPAMAYAWFTKPQGEPGAAYNAALLALQGEAFPASTTRAMELLAADQPNASSFELLHRVTEAHGAAADDGDAARALDIGATPLLTAPARPLEIAIDDSRLLSTLPAQLERLLTERTAAAAGTRETLDKRLRRGLAALAIWQGVAARMQREAKSEDDRHAKAQGEIMGSLERSRRTIAASVATVNRPIRTKGTRTESRTAYNVVHTVGNTAYYNGTLTLDVPVEYDLPPEEIAQQEFEREQARAALARAEFAEAIDQAQLATNRARHDSWRTSFERALNQARSRAEAATNLEAKLRAAGVLPAEAAPKESK